MRLAFLHAFPLDQRMWAEQLGIVPGRCDAPNLYAFGESLDSWAAGVLDSVGTSPIIAIGASMGGSCACLLYTSPSPRDQRGSRMPSSA